MKCNTFRIVELTVVNEIKYIRDVTARILTISMYMYVGVQVRRGDNYESMRRVTSRRHVGTWMKRICWSETRDPMQIALTRIRFIFLFASFSSTSICMHTVHVHTRTRIRTHKYICNLKEVALCSKETLIDRVKRLLRSERSRRSFLLTLSNDLERFKSLDSSQC